MDQHRLRTVGVEDDHWVRTGCPKRGGGVVPKFADTVTAFIAVRSPISGSEFLEHRCPCKFVVSHQKYKDDSTPHGDRDPRSASLAASGSPFSARVRLARLPSRRRSDARRIRCISISKTRTSARSCARPGCSSTRHEDRLVILDEIHRAPELLLTLRGAIDRGRSRGRRAGRFLILGFGVP